MQAGARLVLYMKLNTQSTNLCATLLPKPFEGKPWTAAMVQRIAGVAGDVITIAGKKYIYLKATISHARSNHDAVAGAISLTQIQKKFGRKRDSRYNMMERTRSCH